ncbi:TspO/MBR family protein [Bacillus sp. DJP31]|uniref:TspO/MBR family protein n=1 Tax=Bacillus sp. DJP31 TaxID=3409789 RepID=UPI003BB6E906
MSRFYLNVVAYVTVLAINYFANALPFNGQTTGEIANRLPVLFNPSSYVFSIWGLIYFLIGLWVFSQLLPKRRNAPLYQKTSNLFVLSCLLNSFWIFVWHYEYFLLSVFVMIGLLVTLVFLYKEVKKEKITQFDTVSFSIYLGWISVATIANISYYLVSIGWTGLGLSHVAWTIILLFVASGIAVQFLHSQHDKLYLLVFTWAFVGIGVKNLDAEPFLSYVAFGLSICLVFSLFLLKKD